MAAAPLLVLIGLVSARVLFLLRVTTRFNRGGEKAIRRNHFCVIGAFFRETVSR
jgi:hypothetical protein